MTTLTEADWGRIFAKAWSDDAFRAAYEDDPRAAISKFAEELNIDPKAAFSFPPMPEDMDADKAKAIAEGSAKPQPMYCC
ncbi:MAG: hypothetical protein ABJL67_22165 [Sulfitobacter sp.]